MYFQLKEMSSGDFVDAAPAIKWHVYRHYLISTLQVAAYATTFFLGLASHVIKLHAVKSER